MDRNTRALPETQRRKLRQGLEAGGHFRIVEAHSGLSALVAGSAQAPVSGREFDGFWVSSLTCSVSRGLPDMELYAVDRRLDMISEVAQLTTKPIVVDGDTGGSPSMLKYFCSQLEALGVSAIVVEDKRHPKRNSLSGSSSQDLEDPDEFVRKLRWAKQGLASDDFMIFARIESLVAGRDVTDALQRAATYVHGGADGIMIHSKATTPNEAFAFMDGYNEICRAAGRHVPAMCVPTTYNSVTARALFDRGFQIVCYANHLLRASHTAMRDLCQELLERDRSLDVDNRLTRVSELFEQSGYNAELAELEPLSGRGRKPE